MDMVLGFALLGITLCFIILTLVLIIQIGFLRLDSWAGIAGDGLALGQAFPAWNLFDLDGQLRRTPAIYHWQFLIFVDHALGGFPDLIAGLHSLAIMTEDVEVLVLSRRPKDFCEAMVRGLRLLGPVVSVDQHFYDRYHVRVMPYGYLLNPTGIIRWKGVVNSKALLLHVWEIYQTVEHVPLEEVKR